MARSRQTKASIKKLYEQFIQYGIKTPVSYEEYIKLVDYDPVTRRELQQLFMGRWSRVLKVLAKYYPDVYAKAEAAHKVVEKPKPAPKPKARPAKVEPKKEKEDDE